ncbi:MAG: aryl-sulfate sulfotransferase [Solirubrobacterales bacterium]|nr:aryl-sulfate sulfotransferase [Solirubrobacterales bacterium]
MKIARLTAVATVLMAIGAQPASAASPSLTTTTGLSPVFAADVKNLITACPGGAVNLGISADNKTSVSVDRAPGQIGSRSVTVSLVPGERTVVTITSAAGRSSHSIRCVPDDFPKFTVTGTLPASVGMMAFDNIRSRVLGLPARCSFAIITDRRGVPIWWREEALSLVNVFVTSRGKIALGHSGGPLVLRNPNGAQSGSSRATAGTQDAHEAILTARGTTLLATKTERSGMDLRFLGLDQSSTVIDSNIQEVSSSGRLLWSWASATHLALTETIMPQVSRTEEDGATAPVRKVDIAHINSIAEDGTTGIVASFRNVSGVFRIRKTDGQIDWKLGGTTTSKSLTVTGDAGVDPLRHLLGQHDARLNKDGTLSVLDNGSTIVRNGVSASHPQRVLRFLINRSRKTAAVAEKLQDPAIGSGSCCGSARRMSDGAWLVAWGGLPYIRAYNKSHAVVFALEFSPIDFTYRATPVSSSQVSEATLIAGMDEMASP